MRFVLFAVLLCMSLGRVAVAAPPIDAYGRLPAVDLIDLSPSGKRYAFIASSGEKRNLGVVENGKVIFVHPFGETKVRTIEWVGEDRLLVMTSAAQDLGYIYEFSTLINIDLQSGKVSSIFEKTQKVANVFLDDAGTVFIAGEPYKYFVGLAYTRNTAVRRPGHVNYLFTGDRRNLYRVNLATGELSLQAKGGSGPGFRWLVDNDGSVLAHSVFDADKGLWRLYAGGDDSKMIMERVSDATRLRVPGRTPGTVWISDASSGEVVVEEVSLKDGKREVVFDRGEAGLLLSDPDSRLAIGARLLREPGAKFFDATLQQRLQGALKAFPAAKAQMVSYSRNLDRMIVRTKSDQDAGTYWLVDIASGAADSIATAYPEIAASDIGPERAQTYKAADGVDIKATLTLPPGRKAEQLPLLVLAQELLAPPGDYNLFDWLGQAFAGQGYAVLQADYRQKPITKIQGDLADGVAALAAQGVIDPKRVCIVGVGMGGYAALAGAASSRGIYRCAVSVGGMSDLPAYYEWILDRGSNESASARWWSSLIGDDGEGAAIRISPAAHAAQVSGPVLLIHGRDDTFVPFSQSEKMAAALSKADKAVELVELPGEDHWLSRGDTRKAMLKASLEFVRKHNPPN